MPETARSTHSVWASCNGRPPVAFFVHAVQAVAVLAFATAFALPVTARFMEGPPGTAAGAPTTLFEVSVAWGVALFLLLSALFHWLVVLPGVFGRTPLA